MQVMDLETSRSLKGAIYDLDESGTKQALFGMVNILTMHPTISKDLFLEIIDDARKYSVARRMGLKK